MLREGDGGSWGMSDPLLHVVGLSGGKDSTATALRLAEIEPREYVYFCTPTGDELPEMEAHWEKLELLLETPITRLEYPGGLKALIEEQKMLPNWRARFCTRKLKIELCQKWIDKQDRPVKLYIGLRADEEGREGGEYYGCEIDFPLRRWGWGINEVWDYLRERCVTIPTRTDCARCFFQTLGEWWALHKNHPEIYEDAVQDEVKIGHTYRSPGRDTWPASLAELRDEFEKGRIPRDVSLQEDMFGFSANKCRVCSL